MSLKSLRRQHAKLKNKLTAFAQEIAELKARSAKLARQSKAFLREAEKASKRVDKR